MHFHIQHTTDYVYSEPATEAFSELRLRPRDSRRQAVSRYSLQLQPPVRTEPFVDYFGNHVESVSIPFRHERLVVTSMCDVLTTPPLDWLTGLDLTLAEARLVYAAGGRELFDFLQASHFAPLTPDVRALAAEFLRPTDDFAGAVQRLNRYIFKEFKYTPGVTDASTPVTEFLEKRRGVCQDFAHLMISVCRSAGVPARYVSGYIETDPVTDATTLIGATASHAWVEVYAPNERWIGLDPTNDSLEGERHVRIAIGRDYHDVPPLKGVFKGARAQRLSVEVRVRRNGDAAA